jgi:hypothetical protein
MPPQPGPDECALDENGQLRDAEDIPWFNSLSDKDPIPLPPVNGETVTDIGGMDQHTIFHAIANASHFSSSW